MKPDIRTLNLRLDILSLTLRELARSLPEQDAARAADAIGRGVNRRIADIPMGHTADASIAADLAPLLAALRRH